MILTWKYYTPETGYFQKVEMPLPAAKDDSAKEGNYLVAYDISEATRLEREDLWGVMKFTAEDFPGMPQMVPVFQDMIRCRRPEELREVVHYASFAEYIVERSSEGYEGKVLPPHHSIVIGLIDGATDHWLCGIWCYKNLRGNLEINFVEKFEAAGYRTDAEGSVPCF